MFTVAGLMDKKTQKGSITIGPMLNTITKCPETSLTLYIVFCFLLVDCTPISQWFQTFTLDI